MERNTLYCHPDGTKKQHYRLVPGCPSGEPINEFHAVDNEGAEIYPDVNVDPLSIRGIVDLVLFIKDNLFLR